MRSYAHWTYECIFARIPYTAAKRTGKKIAGYLVWGNHDAAVFHRIRWRLTITVHFVVIIKSLPLLVRPFLSVLFDAMTFIKASWDENVDVNFSSRTISPIQPILDWRNDCLFMRVSSSLCRWLLCYFWYNFIQWHNKLGWASIISFHMMIIVEFPMRPPYWN